jgi:hypothetical protein
VQNNVTATLVDFSPTNGPFSLPHASTTVQVSWNLRCYDDANGNHAYDTNELSTVYNLSRTHHDITFNMSATDLTFDKDHDGLPDLWERLYDVVSMDDPSDVLADPDGDLLVNLHEYYSGTNPGVADANPVSNALLNASLAIDSRIAGKNPTNALPLFLNYILNGTTNVFIRNPDCWAADIDLTCCSPWNSHSGNGWGWRHRAGTLISPRHVLFATHFDDIPTNRILRFIDLQNQIVERVLIAKLRHPLYSPYYPDITIGLLNEDVPTNRINFAKVLPNDYREYFGDGHYLPVLSLDQEEKALINELWSISSGLVSSGATSFLSPTDLTRKGFYEQIIEGDSGNPSFLILNNQPVLLTTWTSPNSGTSVTGFKQDINTMMLQLEVNAGCTNGYQLQEIDLAGFLPCQ